MKKLKTIVPALIALCAGAAPAMAQVVIGNSGASNVEVNWSVLNSLGPSPNIAGMVARDGGGAAPAAQAPSAPVAPAIDGVVFKPYVPMTKPSHTKGRDGERHVSSHHIGRHSAAEKSITPHPVEKTSGQGGKAVALAVPKPAAAPAMPALEQTRAQHSEPHPSETTKKAAPAKEPPAVAANQAPAQPTPMAAPSPAPAPIPVSQVSTAPAPAAVRASPPTPAVSVPAVSVPAVAKPQSAVAPAPAHNDAGGKNDVVSVVFPADGVDLPNGARGNLTALARRMAKDDNLNLQLLAYAQGDESNVSKARRLSLSRALEVRKFLMEQGIRSTRIDVRALGNKVEGGGSPDRVDAVVGRH